jgi:response regulator RpfG family c-di-GMP phosphodiesterase
MSDVTKRSRVLIADDDRDIRHLLSMKLRVRGLTVDLAVNGERAYQMIAHAPYDALITDIRMPGMNGHELASKVLSTGRVPVVVVMTGMREPRLVSDLIARGVAAVEIKPLDFEVVAAMVHAYIDRQRESGSFNSPNTDLTASLDSTVGLLRKQLNAVESDFDRVVSNLETEKKRIQDEFFDTVQVFSKMLSQTGQYSGSHASRVEAMSAYVGERAGMTSQGLRYLRLAALMHDIGQFGMPEQIITKAPHAMDEGERAVFQRYPEFGAMLLRQTPSGAAVADMIAAHRENYDGTGFPHRLSGEGIPLGARVLRVSDSVDNVYSHALERRKEAVLRHLTQESGRAFDPELVKLTRDFLEQDKGMVDDPPAILGSDALTPGMILAEHAYDPEGRFLAREGTELTEVLIRRLQAIVKHVRVRPAGG